ncbi:hypothetical protein GCM10019016_006720 [Streptomyces prasinosporus]|uniref:Uncharacterized protein n=1 Tax=Streptomyces prasinosporus TaxID=68256 RepID=A0ABP6TGA8_9ACTN
MATGVFSSVPTWNGFLFARYFVDGGVSRPAPPMTPPVFRTPDEPDRDGAMAASAVTTVPAPAFLLLRTRAAPPGPRTGRRGKGPT